MALKTIDTHVVADAIAGALNYDESCGLDVRGTVSFAEDGVLTSDAGFTLYLTDGTAYQVTVVQSKR